MGGKGPSSSTENQQQQISQEQINLAEQSNARSQKLFDLGLPGLEKANQYYSDLASGDQTKMTQAEAPALEGIDAQTAGAQRSIDAQQARGGVKDLAKEEATVSGAGQKGNLLTQAYTSSFPALAQIGQGGVGLSINQVANALSGFSGAANTTSSLANEQQAGKATQMAFMGSLIGAGGEAAAACWIAEVLWSVDDSRTHLVRRWLNTVWDKTFVGHIVMQMYRRYGREVAAFLKRNQWAKPLLRPIFNRALECARREYGMYI